MFGDMRPTLFVLSLSTLVLAGCVGSGHSVPASHPAAPSAAVTPLPAVAAAITHEDAASAGSAQPHPHHHHHHSMPGGAAHE
jgi:hypothetical protein